MHRSRYNFFFDNNRTCIYLNIFRNNYMVDNIGSILIPLPRAWHRISTNEPFHFQTDKQKLLALQQSAEKDQYNP